MLLLPRRAPWLGSLAVLLLSLAPAPALAQTVIPLPLPAPDPADLILSMDNSASMGDEAQAIEAEINGSLAAPIAAAGIDYRVLVVSRHGSSVPDESLCIAQPLSGTSCNPVPGTPITTAIFDHFSVEIGSRDMWCQLLASLAGADEFGLYIFGLEPQLRAAAQKSFIGVSDDGIDCVPYDDSNSVAGGNQAAADFDADLLAASPAQFGTAGDRKYVYHSIVAVPENGGAPYLPSEPIQTNECATGVNSGTGHQALSIETGGLRFSQCETNSYDVIFTEIAGEVVSRSRSVWCEQPLPDLMGADPAGVTLRLTPSTGPAVVFPQVADEGACAGQEFWIDGGQVRLCPEACDATTADASPTLDLLVPAAVPLLGPGGLALLAGGLAGAGGWIRGKRRRGRRPV